MDRIQLAHLRDFAIEYLPEAQTVREQEKIRPVDGDRDTRPYATRLWNVTQKIIPRQDATGIELAAAMLLGALTEWELFESSPSVDKLVQAYTGQDTKYTRDKMLPGIANAVTTLNNVTGKNIQFASPLAYAEEAAEQTEPLELSLNDAVRINEAANGMGCTVESLLKEAANEDRLLYVAIKPHSSKLVAIPSHPNPIKASHSTKAPSIVAMLPDYAASLAIAGSADIAKYQAAFDYPPLDWHYWMLDVPQTVGVDSVFVRRSDLVNDDALTATEETPSLTQTEALKPWLVHDPRDPDPEQPWYTPTTPPISKNQDEKLAALFDPVPVEALAQMFPVDKLASLDKWKAWAERAKRNELNAAREGRAKFNPYKAGMWLVDKGWKDWDIARINRVLIKNLPARSLHESDADLLKGDL